MTVPPYIEYPGAEGKTCCFPVDIESSIPTVCGYPANTWIGTDPSLFTETAQFGKDNQYCLRVGSTKHLCWTHFDMLFRPEIKRPGKFPGRMMDRALAYYQGWFVRGYTDDDSPFVKMRSAEDAVPLQEIIRADKHRNAEEAFKKGKGSDPGPLTKWEWMPIPQWHSDLVTAHELLEHVTHKYGWQGIQIFQKEDGVFRAEYLWETLSMDIGDQHYEDAPVPIYVVEWDTEAGVICMMLEWLLEDQHGGYNFW